jgi:hypothetical protein
MVTFKRQDTLGGGFSIEALDHKMLVGHIRKQPGTRAFRYYRGVHNDLTPIYEDRDLEALERRVRENP